MVLFEKFESEHRCGLKLTRRRLHRVHLRRLVLTVGDLIRDEFIRVDLLDLEEEEVPYSCLIWRVHHTC